MKKILAALVLSLAVSVTAFAKEEVWQYNQFTTIDELSEDFLSGRHADSYLPYGRKSW